MAELPLEPTVTELVNRLFESSDECVHLIFSRMLDRALNSSEKPIEEVQS